MKKKKIIILISILLLILIVLLAYWQRNNLVALKYAMSYTEEEQKELQNNNEKLMENISEKISEEGMEILSDEAIQMLNEGTLSEEEAAQIITKKTTLTEIKNKKNTQNFQNTSQKLSNSSENQIANLIAKIYVLRSSFVGRLDALVAQGKAELAAGKISKGALAKKYIGLGLSLEAECDAQMENIISQVKSELQKNGGDLSLIQEIRSAYQNEKSIKKATIISQYKK